MDISDMRFQSKSKLVVSGIIALVMFSLFPGNQAAAQAADSKAATNAPSSDALPDGPGKDLVTKKCTACHSVKTATSKRGTQDQWADTVSTMIGRGADLSDDEAATVVEYLAAHFGPSAAQGTAPPESEGSSKAAEQTSVNVNKATAAELESKLGLSEADATAVVDYRQKSGDFKNIDALASVPGIDASKIRSEKSKITF